ncbi:MAG: response regulator [Oculatellaceae cyanobacterium Prado106]|nr:response regulator [Oculatellaceae cyanobacterium Prado106]
MKILLADPDETTSDRLTRNLATHRYVVDRVRDGETGWIYGSTFDYDLMLLDLMLPKLDGISLCQRFRAEGYTTPILLLSDQDSITAKVRGLDAGADDYIVKPFDLTELNARMRALLRRSSANPFPLLIWGNLLLNPSSCEVSYDNQTLSLTTKEYELLELFMRETQHVFSTEEILGRLWTSEEFPSEATVRSHIRRVRQKLAKAGAPTDFIATVHGRGYYLKADPGAEDAPQDGSPVPLPTQKSSFNPSLKFLNETWSSQKPAILSSLSVFEAAIATLTPTPETPTPTAASLQGQAHHTARHLVGILGTFGLTQAMAIVRQLEQAFNPAQSTVQSDLADATMLTEQIHTLRQSLQDQQEITDLGAIAPSLPHPTDQGTKVMIVDADPIWLQALPKLLQPWGFKVTTLANPQEFWLILEAVNPDMLILDIQLPVTNGFELCQAVRSNPHWHRLPILFLSSLTDQATQNHAFTLGADDYLCKPILGIDLANRILNRLQRIKAWTS